MTTIGHAAPRSTPPYDLNHGYFIDEPNTSAALSDLEFTPTLATCHPSRFVYRHWVRATAGMRNGITRAVVAIAVHAATHPWLLILSVLGFTAGMLAVGLKTNFYLELELRDIFTPTTSKSIRHREWALHISQLPGYSASNVPFKVVIHSHGQNVITYEGVERAFEVWELATSLRGIDHLCSENEEEMEINLDTGYIGNCEFQAITGFWDHKRALFEKEVPPDDDITRFLLSDTYPDGTTVDMDRILGNLIVQEDGIPMSAEALFVEIAVPFNSQWVWFKLFDYADQLQDGITEMRKSWASSNTGYAAEFVFDYSISNEFEQTILSDFPLLPFVFTVMLGFCCCVFWKPHRVQSRLLLALGAVSTVVLSMATGFGLMFLVGVPYTVVTNILPYIIFGVGLDDTFIIYGAFERSDPKKEIVDRIREVFEEVGLSITMTTLTTSLAFGLGCISTIPAIRDICFYAWPTVLIDGLYQVSFFVSLIVLDERRIQSNRTDCCPCVVAPTSSTAGTTSDGITDSNDSSSDNGDDNSTHKTYPAASTGEGAKQDIAAIENSPQLRRSTQFMGWYANQLLRPWVRMGVLLAFAVLFVASIYSSTFLRQDFSFFDLLPSDSPTRSYLSSLENYGGVNGDVYMYFRGLNQSDADVQDQIIDFIDQIAAIEHIELKPFCFVKDFRALMEDPSSFVDGLMDNPSAARLLEANPGVTQFVRSVAASSTFEGLTFNELVDLVFSQPMIEKVYSRHVKRDENGDVYTSRCTVMIKNLDYNSVGDQIALLQAQNEVTDNHPLNQNTKEYHCFLYKDIFHLWEFFDVAMKELRYTAATGIVTVTIFAFLFVPHWSGVFYILPLMCVLYVDLLGLFQAFGLTINVLTYVTLVVSVGLLVDFLMHALLRYYESTKQGREARVKDMLMTMGASILLGGLSTFLGSVPLAFSKSAVFRTIYIAFFCMISLGLSHGLVLLPVLLSMFGTTTTTGNTKNMPPELEPDTKILSFSAAATHESTKARLKDDNVEDDKSNGERQTQDTCSSFSHHTASDESPECPPPSSPRNIRVSDYDYEHSAYRVEQVVQSSNTYEQFEVTLT